MNKKYFFPTFQVSKLGEAWKARILSALVNPYSFKDILEIHFANKKLGTKPLTAWSGLLSYKD